MMNEDLDIYQHMVEEIEEYAILFLDKSGNVKNWNKGAEKIKGYTTKEIVGQNFSIFYTEADRAEGAPEKMLKQAMKEGNARAEGWRVRKDGSLFWGSVLITAIYANTNILQGFTKITRDLTEKRTAEEQLQQLNAQLEEKIAQRTKDLQNTHNSYQHLFTSNPLPMWVLDIHTFAFLDVNDVALFNYGYTKEEFLSMTAIDIRPREEQNIFIDTDHPGYISAEESNRGVWSHRKKNGEIIEAEIFAHNIIFDGREARLILAKDVTEKRAAEKKLASRVKYFRALLENNNDCISLQDAKGNIIYQSPAVERVSGYTMEDLRGMSAYDFFHPEDVKDVLKRIETSLANPGKAIWGINRLRHRDGHYIWTEGTTTNLLDNEDVCALVSNFRDVTERKLAGEALSKTKREVEKVYREQILLAERMSSILNALPANIALIDNKGIIVEINDAWRRFADANGFIGSTYGIGDNYIDIADNATGSDADDGKKIARAIRGILAGNISEFNMEYRCDAPDKPRWLRVIITRENDSAESGIVLMHIDITERKQAEQQLETSYASMERLLHHTDEAFIMLDKRLNIVSFNRNAFVHTNKYLNRSMHIGLNVLDFAAPEIFERSKELYSDVLKGNKRETEMSFKGADGISKHFLNIVRPTYNSMHEVDGAFITIRDITEVVEVQARIAFDRSNMDALINNTRDLMWSIDTEGRMLSFNHAFDDIVFSMTGSRLVKGEVTPPGFNKEQLELWTLLYERAFGGEIFTHLLYTEGYDLWAEISLYPIYNGAEIIGVACYSRDITERKKTEEKIRESEETKRLIMNASMDAIMCMDGNGIITVWNPQAEKMFGWSEAEIIGQRIKDTVIPENDRGRHAEGLANYFDNSMGIPLNTLTEDFAVRRNGEIFPIEITVLPIEQNGNEFYCAFLRDITERKQAEQKIITMNRLYGFISQINQSIVHATDMATVFKEACSIAVKYGKFKMAWIGVVDQERKSMKMMEQCGMPEADHVLFEDVVYADGGPIDSVMKTGRYFVYNNIEEEYDFQEWSGYAKQRGLQSCIILPVKSAGKLYGVINLYSSVANFFDQEEIRLLQEVAGDISFALYVFEKERLRQLADEKLRLNEFRLNEAQEIAHVGNWEIDMVTGAHSWSQEILC